MSEATGREARDAPPPARVRPEDAASAQPRRPLEADALIVDEASMLDTVARRRAPAGAVPPTRGSCSSATWTSSLGRARARCCATSSRSGAVPTSCGSTQIFRQAEASLIVANAHRIHDGELPESAHRQAGPRDFYFVERRSREDAPHDPWSSVTERIPQRFGLDPRRRRAGADADAQRSRGGRA